MTDGPKLKCPARIIAGLFRGSTFVDSSFRDMLSAKFARDYPEAKPHHLSKGVTEFSTSSKLQFSDTDRQARFLLLGNDTEFDQGCIELSWYVFVILEAMFISIALTSAILQERYRELLPASRRSHCRCRDGTVLDTSGANEG